MRKTILELMLHGYRDAIRSTKRTRWFWRVAAALNIGVMVLNAYRADPIALLNLGIGAWCLYRVGNESLLLDQLDQKYRVTYDEWEKA